MCSAGVCVCVCVCVRRGVCLWVFQLMLDINRNDAWKDRVHGCIVGTSEKTRSRP